MTTWTVANAVRTPNGIPVGLIRSDKTVEGEQLTNLVFDQPALQHGEGVGRRVVRTFFMPSMRGHLDCRAIESGRLCSSRSHVVVFREPNARGPSERATN